MNEKQGMHNDIRAFVEQFSNKYKISAGMSAMNVISFACIVFYASYDEKAEDIIISLVRDNFEHMKKSSIKIN